jgi:hypothetical protein
LRQLAAAEPRLGAAVIGEATDSCACFDDWLEISPRSVLNSLRYMECSVDNTCRSYLADQSIKMSARRCRMSRHVLHGSDTKDKPPCASLVYAGIVRGRMKDLYRRSGHDNSDIDSCVTFV